MVFAHLAGKRVLPLDIARSLGAIVLLAVACIPAPAAAQVVIDTDAMTIDGVASGGTFGGTPFSVVDLGNHVVQFRFSGDLRIDDGVTVTAVGQRGVSLYAENDAYVGEGVLFEFSAQGQTPGAGGGAGAGATSDDGRGGGGGWNSLEDDAAYLHEIGWWGRDIFPGEGGESGGKRWIDPGGGFGGHTEAWWDPDVGGEEDPRPYVHWEGQPGEVGGGGTPGFPGYVGTAGASGQSGQAGINGGIGGAGGDGGEAGQPGDWSGRTPGGPARGGAGGSAGTGGPYRPDIFQNGYDGGDGGRGEDGPNGAAGGAGADGQAGSGGINGGAGLMLSGGGGGGSGGQGGGGGGGGQAGGGGGGGSGGGGGGSWDGLGRALPGGHGARGGQGGEGGHGGAGGDGGAGGAGGGGGGAFEIVARGRVQVGAGTHLRAAGADGAAGTVGATGEIGESGDSGMGGGGGLPGTVAWPYAGGSGGDGGRGGNGGTGGDGGNGGAGQSGGGGAGGTVKLFGSVVEAPGAQIDASGGLAGDGTASGGAGRFVVGSNTATSIGAVKGATISGFDGSRDTNRFVANGGGAGETPYIPGLDGGAELYGLLSGFDALDIVFEATRLDAPEDALAAILRLDVGPGAYGDDFIGFDMILFVNLQGEALDAPRLGVGEDGLDAAFLESLLLGGLSREAPELLAALGAYGIWATLIPESASDFNASLAGGRAVIGAQLAAGESTYVSAVPEPSTGVLVGLGLVWLARRSRCRDGSGHLRGCFFVGGTSEGVLR